MRVLKSAEGKVLGLAFSPDGQALACAVEGQGVFLWNLQSYGPPVRLDTSASYRARDLYFTPDGQSVGWLDKSGWRVYDRETKSAAQIRLDARGPLNWLIPSPDPDRVVSQHFFPEAALMMWRRTGAGWEREWDLAAVELGIEDVTIDPGARRLAMLTRKAVGAGWQQQPYRVELRSAASSAVEATGSYPYSHHCRHCRLAFSPDGEQLVGAHEMTLLIWAVPDLGDPVVLRNDNRKHFTSLAYHPTGRHLFVASNDATVHVFDTAGWGRPARYSWDVGPLKSVAVSRDGLLAATGGEGGEIVVWDVDL